MDKSVQIIISEWQALETKSPGGSLSNVTRLLELAATVPCPSREQHLLKIIEILHNTVQSYHVEMGVLISCLESTASAPSGVQA